MYSYTLSLTSAVDGVCVCLWLTSHTARFTPRERPGTSCVAGWMGPMAGLDGY
jgi:hypothetical protein